MHAIDEKFKCAKASLGCLEFLAESHTGDAIQEQLHAIYYGFLENPRDQKFLPVVTTDQGGNMKKAVDSQSSKMFWMKCSLHLLHNAVKSGLK